MKWIGSIVLCSAFGCTQLPAQAVEQTRGKSATQATATSASNQELNIDAYIELLRTDVRKSKSQIMGQVMQFNPNQAATFWPIYQQFDATLTKIGDRTKELIRKYADNYGQMSGDVADQLATELLELEQQRNDLKKQYYHKIKQAIDPITAARFLQVENQLERLIDLEISAGLPVIGSRGKTQ